MAVCGIVPLLACAAAEPTRPTMAAPLPPSVVAPAQAWPPARIDAELARLRAAVSAELPRRARCGQAGGPEAIGLAERALAVSGFVIDRPQLVVVVDRNPRSQSLCVLLTQRDTPWQPITGSRVSTGQAGRRGYFLTPTGVFRHTPDVLDYRAEGTFNENHIRGLGLKGMRVWDFGWQRATKGWTKEDPDGEIRLLMHATDPDVLERRLGRPASKGCVRVPAAMNRFLDRHGVLDSDYERAAIDDPRYGAVLLPDRDPTPLAGDTLIVVDTSVVQEVAHEPQSNASLTGNGQADEVARSNKELERGRPSLSRAAPGPP